MPNSVQRLSVLVIICLFIAPVILLSDEASDVDGEVGVINFQLKDLQKKCQIAIWLTDSEGDFVSDIYVTRKIAKKGLGNRGGGLLIGTDPY